MAPTITRRSHPITRTAVVALLGVAALALASCRLAGVGAPTSEGSGAQAPARPSAPNLGAIAQAELQPDGSGFLVDADHELFWTSDAGGCWLPLAPPVLPDTVTAEGERILAAELVEVPGGDLRVTYEVAVSLSEDRGSTWTTSRVEVPGQPGQLRASIRGEAVVILVQQTTGINFSLADILVSTDGKEWDLRSAPAAGQVGILAADELWIAGGATANQLFRSSDLGRNWDEVNVTVGDSDPFSLDLPRATSASGREVVATINGETTTLALLCIP